MGSLWLSSMVVLTALQIWPSESTAGCKLDIGFILDGSGSIQRSGFLKEIDFVKKVASMLDVSNANSHVSVMTFESRARMVTYFKDTSAQSKQHLYSKMNAIIYRGGGTNTEGALNLARTQMFARAYGARPSCTKVLIIFTDGRSASGVNKVRIAAQKLKDMGVNMISIGVGSSISSAELHAMASNPTANHVFTVASANLLNQIVNRVQTEICRVTNCWQAECQYHPWSSWSSSCGQASRQRNLKAKQYVMKKVVGGCAGYSTSCSQLTESKNLGNCIACKLDIGFVLDESGSIGSSGFNQELHFVKNIAKQLSVSSTNTHVSVMTFSSSARIQNYFKDSNGQSQYQLERLVNSIRYRGGGTDTERALELARTHMFYISYGARPGVSKIVVVFTDGRSASGVTRVRNAAQKLKDMGINMISIGVGSQISTDELNAMSSSSAHMFRVSSASLLSSIVSKVKEESCKTFTCVYVECVYSQWGAWSKTCGNAVRQRQQLKAISKTKQVIGGCAGLPKTCNKLQEQKNAGVCLLNCRYAECGWGSWGSWSTSCGYGTRTRTIATTFKYLKRASCNGLAQSCRSNRQYGVRNIDCSCSYASCTWGSWGSWSTTCGHATRSRKLVAQKKTIMRKSCHGLQQTCSNSPNYDSRKIYCSCPYVQCTWGAWSSWSTTCGDGVRTRKYVANKRTISRYSCSGLPQSCSTTSYPNYRRTYCSCPYVSCSWGSWAAWSTSCGVGVRSRKLAATKRNINRINCSGLPQTCSSKPQNANRNINCACSYVQCKTGSWGAWSTSCGTGTRTRKVETVKKTAQRTSCNGLTTTCFSIKTSETRKTHCTCNYVVCNYGPWSAWTTTCGAGERTRKMIATKKTVQKASCDGLLKKCTTALDVDKRNKLCNCNYVECNYGSWSAWTTTCGAGERTRKMIATPKTVQKASCDGLLKTCTTALDVDKRNKLCTCKYVECNYGPWSAWTATCGIAERARKMIATPKTVQKASCDGLLKTCTTALDVDKRNKSCTCNYVECNYGPWSAWTTTCGAGERTRKMIATPKTVQKASCDGLLKTCTTALDVDKRDKLCSCNYVECNYGSWSAWATTCGAGERTRRMIATPKTVQKASCDGLLKTCNTALDVDKRNKLCTCKYVECNYGPWSAWTATCGVAERARKMIATPKTVQKASCDGLLKTCTTALDVDKRNKSCTCNYVECNYGPWSAWTTTCGAGERTRKMIATPKTVQKASCDGLLKTCTTALDVDKRDKLCSCNYVECNYGSWSAWATTCGAGERTRRMIATPKTVQKASCDGLLKTCNTALDVDKRNKLCTCKYVECNYGPWSAWTATCGVAERARKMIATPKTVQKASCDGLLKTCTTALDVDKRNKLCTCNYVECNYGSWSAWTTTCGDGERARTLIATPKTVQKAKCDDLPKKCSTSPDISTRKINCTCHYKDCSQWSEWSSWTTSCGSGTRSRNQTAVAKTVERESCSGLPQKCNSSTEDERRNILCQCETVRCQPSEWSQWSATCGPATRKVRIITIPVTRNAVSCSGLPTKCENGEEIQQRDTVCPSEPNRGSRPTCSVNFKSLGCYKDDMKTPRPMPELLLTERDSTHHAWNGKLIDWVNWDSYMMKLICRCAEKTKSKKYAFFGIQFYGECWSGPEAGGTYSRNGLADPGSCIKEKYAPCLLNDKYCIGQKETNFVYQVIP